MASGKNGKIYLDSILDEQEQTQIKRFVENEKLKEAVKKALLAGLYEQGTIKKHKPADSLSNVAFGLLFEGDNPTNEKLGAKVRALWEGIRNIENAFEFMEGYKEIQSERSENKNQAR